MWHTSLGQPNFIIHHGDKLGRAWLRKLLTNIAVPAKFRQRPVELVTVVRVDAICVEGDPLMVGDVRDAILGKCPQSLASS